MIRFQCKHCGHRMKADDRWAGKRVRCSNCRTPVQIVQSDAATSPPKPALIKFRCPNCTQKIGLPPEYAGKVVRCAKCKHRLRVPQAPSEAAPPKPKDDLLILTADQELSPADESGLVGLEGMSDLLQLEARPPAVGEPLRLSPIEETDDVSGLPAYASQFTPTPPYQDIEDPIPKKKNRMIPFIITAVCLLILCGAGFILVSGVLKFIDYINAPIPVDARLEEAREFTEDYIALLAKGDVNTAQELLTPGLKKQIDKGRIESLARQIGKREIVELVAGLTHFVESSGDNQFYFWYNISYGQDIQMVIVSVVEIDNKFKVDGMAALEPSGKTVVIGSKSYQQLVTTAMLSELKNMSAHLWKAFCAIVVVILILNIIQVVAWWVLFEKAGRPGWAAVIPFYNMWVLAEVGNKPGWMGLAWFFSGFIPCIGPIVQMFLGITISISVAETFRRGILFGIALFFLPLIFYPILAFGSD